MNNERTPLTKSDPSVSTRMKKPGTSTTTSTDSKEGLHDSSATTGYSMNYSSIANKDPPQSSSSGHYELNDDHPNHHHASTAYNDKNGTNAVDGDDEEEEHVEFLNSDDDAEEYEDDLEDDLEGASGPFVTFSFDDDDEEEEEDDDDDDVDDDDDEEYNHGNGGGMARRGLAQSEDYQVVNHHCKNIDNDDNGSFIASSPLPQRRRKRRKHPSSSLVRFKSTRDTSDQDAHGNYSQSSAPSHGRLRSHSIDTQNTGFTQNTAFSEAIVASITHAKEAIVEGITEVSHAVSEVLHEEIRPVQPRPEGHHAQKLSALALAVLVFYKVSGGPFGCEPAVRSAGPFWALLGFCTFPFVWCLQEALVTAELGSAFPEPSGSVAWVEEAFGTKAGLICGYFHWVAGATDNAIYPSLFLEYVVSYITGLEDQRSDDAHDGDHPPWLSNVTDIVAHDSTVRFLLCAMITILLSMLNFLGLEIVGNVSMVVCVISMSPFFILFLLGLPKVVPSRWFALPDPNSTVGGGEEDDDGAFHPGWMSIPNFAGVIWRPFLNNLFWNLNSFDVGASFAGEVKDPERIFPRAMFLSILFVTLSYIFTLFVAIGAADDSQEDWKAGHLSVVASEVVGPWLGAWTVFAAAIGNIALFEAEMSGDAFQLLGMGERGLVPRLFAKRSKFGTPTYGILLGTAVIIILSTASFDAIVEMLNFAYSLSLLMEFAAFIKLRITDDDVHRPYRIPLGVWGCIVFVTPACLLCIILVMMASKTTYIYFVILCSFGMVFHFIQKAAKHYNLWEYASPPAKKRRSSLTPLVPH